MQQNADLIRAINRAYHEEEAAVYDESHPEIFERERATWKHLASFLPKHTSGIRILDIGSGTGFVLETLANYLGAHDTFILSDISPGMLEKAKRKFATYAIPHIEFVLTDAEHLPFAKEYFDVVTMNSVLHHIPDTPKFLQEVKRVLKPGGLCIIAHEPNRKFFLNPFLRLMMWCLHKYLGFCARLKKLGGIRRSATLSHEVYKTIYARTNARLQKDGLIASNLSGEDIQSYVDIHSPTARGSIDSSKGFVINELHTHYFADFQLIFFRTHAHLGKIDSASSRILQGLDKLLSRLFPRSGSSFSAVFRL